MEEFLRRRAVSEHVGQDAAEHWSNQSMAAKKVGRLTAAK
jgi:hypothetical protein